MKRLAALTGLLFCVTLNGFAQNQQDIVNFFRAIEEANFEIFEYYLSNGTVKINFETTNYSSSRFTTDLASYTITPLAFVCYTRANVSVFGADIDWNYKNERRDVVLKRMLVYLLDHGAKVNWTNKAGNTCLKYFFLQRDDIFYNSLPLDWFQLLLSKGLNVKIRNSNEMPFLFETVRIKDLEGFKALVRAGLDPYVLADFADVKKLNLLQYSIINKLYATGYQIIPEIYKYSFNINYQDSNGNTVLHYLIKNGTVDSYTDERLDLLRQLLRDGANQNIKNREGKTPFEIAMERNQQFAINVLLQYR